MQKRRLTIPNTLLLSAVLCCCGLFSPDSEGGYSVTLPEDKLPWPHHKPSYSQKQYNEMLEDLWVINNFGQYQGAETNESVYFHNGLDIVIPNGTPIFAIKSGTVRHLSGNSPSGGVMIIEDEDLPWHAWAYIHVWEYQVEVGDRVKQGTHVAGVSFPMGLDHIHLSRMYLPVPGTWHSLEHGYYVQPDGYFFFTDTEPPVIETPFYYFANNSDSMFTRTTPAIVSGDVDIVIGIRDQGEYARRKSDRYGDRLCINRVEYEISGEGIATVHKHSFDFSKMILERDGQKGYELVSVVYKFRFVIDPEPPTSWSRIFSHYIITNCDGTGEFGLISREDQNFAWNTATTDQSRNPLFPDGLYTITVTAYDFKGNYSTETDSVYVLNNQEH